MSFSRGNPNMSKIVDQSMSMMAKFKASNLKNLNATMSNIRADGSVIMIPEDDYCQGMS